MRTWKMGILSILGCAAAFLGLFALQRGVSGVAADDPTSMTPYPDWAYEARLAGIAFEPEMSDDEIVSKLSQAARDGVSVVVADAPTGWSYAAWTNEAEFRRVLALMRDRVIPRAHGQGLKVAWYLTSLELICGGCAHSGRRPSREHPDWIQVDRRGRLVEFTGVEEIFWLEPDDVDAWMSPESPYRDFYISRIRDVAAAGPDGLWLDVAYLQNSIGQFDGLWPSYDPFSRAAFEEAYGHPSLPAKNWSDLAWRHFVRWRMSSIADFLRDVAQAAHEVKPDLAFFTENWCMDSNFVTQYAQDPLEFLSDPFVATAHELEPVEQEGSGNRNASLKEWRDYALMVKFAAASNSGKPGWVLTYAGDVDDSLREAGVHLAEAANFYEARGPEMLDDSTGSRPLVFPWIAANAGPAYHGRSLAGVAVWYSPRSRDFIDGERAGESKFDYDGTTYMLEYRSRAHDLMKAQIPFDIVTSGWPPLKPPSGRVRGDPYLVRYEWLVVPGAACLSDDEAAILKDYAAAGGRLVVTGDTGSRDEWGQRRERNALEGIATHPFWEVRSDALSLSLPGGEQERLWASCRTGKDADGEFVFLGLANFDRTRLFQNLGLSVKLPPGFSPTSASWSSPDYQGGSLFFELSEGRLAFSVPALKTAAAVVIR